MSRRWSLGIGYRCCPFYKRETTDPLVVLVDKRQQVQEIDPPENSPSPSPNPPADAFSLLVLSPATSSQSQSPSPASLPLLSFLPAPPLSDFSPISSPEPSPATTDSSAHNKSPTLALAPAVADNVGHEEANASNMETERDSSFDGMNGGQKASVVVAVVISACIVGLGTLIYNKCKHNVWRSELHIDDRLDGGHLVMHSGLGRLLKVSGLGVLQRSTCSSGVWRPTSLPASVRGGALNLTYRRLQGHVARHYVEASSVASSKALSAGPRLCRHIVPMQGPRLHLQIGHALSGIMVHPFKGLDLENYCYSSSRVAPTSSKPLFEKVIKTCCAPRGQVVRGAHVFPTSV
ncbi:classical arabinogalactan protein 1-like [Forsythia ovata]|uniref:Classical arabinogalactan protein 1-like n=1 Tax=Forsythia ovata TaxID=205694 RepID=A0ABD1W9A9_9LAMI